MKNNSKRILAALLCLVMLIGMLPAVTVAAADEPAVSQIPIYEDTSYSFAERAADLVARMTLKQKGSQLVEGSPAISAADLGGGALNTKATKSIARYSWWSEALHGYLRDNMNPQSEGTKDNVSYVQSLTTGSTWNPELYYKAAGMIADEIRERAITNSLGNSLNLNMYSPTVNMQRDPRWGRNEESYSEDPLLVATMGSQFVLGMEGKNPDGTMIDPDGYYKTLTTIKHYVANNTEAIRTSGGATTDLRALREYYCAPYREVIQASDVRSVMTAYSSLNGEPCSYSSYLMDTLLRQTYGFSGYITSDCDSAKTIANLNYTNPRTGVKLTAVEQMAGALAHGEDLECNSGITAGVGDYNQLSEQMVEAGVQTDKGTFTENTIDVSVHRLMTARISTGEFDEDLAYTNQALARKADQAARGINNYTPERLAVVDQQTEEGVVLLKNDDILPLDIPATGEYTVAIVGQWQTDMYLGLYSSEQRHAQDDVHRINIQRGLREAFQAVNPDVKFTYVTSNTLSATNEAAIAAADVAIVVTGTGSSYSAEGRDRSSIVLPNNQATLISNVGKLNPNTIAIMETCGPMQVTKFENDVKAILWSSFGGIRKGVGFGKIITGAVNPSGHLTSTWHQNDSDIPNIRNYNMYNTNGDSGRTYMYYNGAVAPSYVFGYGLSYTTFEYSNLKIDKTAYDANDTIKVSFDVKNTGDMAGKDVTQLYIAQPDAPAELLRPIRQLRGFEKIELQPGETKTVEMEVAIPDLAYYYEEDDCFKVDTGRYQVQVGEDSAHANLTADFTVSGEMDVYPTILTVKANQDGDDVLGVEERIIFDKGATINPQLTVAMNDESLYGYIIKEQTSIIKSLKSCDLPEGMTFTYESNRPSVVKVEGDVIKAVGPGVATVTVTGELDGHVVTADFVAYVESSANIDGIKVNGELLEGFSRECYTYELSGYDKAPTVEAVSNNDDLDITVTQAAGVPGTAVIRCEYAAANQVLYYRVGFGKAPVSTDFSDGWAAAQAKGWSVLNGNDKAAFGADGLTITAEKGEFGNAAAPANVYMESATGEWVAQTYMTLDGLSASGQKAGLIVYDDADNSLQMVYQQTSATAGALRLYNRVAGATTQVASVTVSAADGVYLQAVKQGADYTFNYSVDGKSWSNLATKVNNLMACPQVGVLANTGTTDAAAFTANFDGITISKVALLYPRLSGITIDGQPLTGFEKETFFYSYEMPADAEKAPVVGGIPADEELTVECKQLEGTPFGTASITVSTDIASQTYIIAFNHGPMSDYFADGDISDVWTVLRENESAYEINKGEGLVLPTQRYDIYSTGAAWENCFVAPAVGNWQVVAKVHYPVRPNANYQQAMLLVWQDEDNYIRMNCQQNSLKLEPGVETGGSFSASLNSANAQANADGTVTLYFMIGRQGNNYSVSYSQDGLTYTNLGTATNINYKDPKIGLFASMNNSGNQIKANYEYLAVTSIGGVEEMNYGQMLDWAAQNVADYVAADIPAEVKENIEFSKIPHGYSMAVESSDPTVITNEGVVLPSGSDKTVTLTVKITEGSASGSATVNVKVPGTGGGCDHTYEAVVTEPTCTEGGFTTNTCSKCGEVVKTNEVPALGHDWDAGVVTKPATETEDGEKTFTCARCDETYTEVIPATGKVDMSDIDFTKPASASRYTVDNQTATEIRDGQGLYLVTTAEAFEPCNGQIETFEPRDVVKIRVKDDWTATMKFGFSQASAANGYYQFFGFYAAAGDDYQNLAGIRGGDGAMQNFLRVNGNVTADTEGVNSTPGLAENGTYWWRIVKEGTTYTCYRSADGKEFTEMFKYEDTGIAADAIIIDAYTGMTEGYEFLVESLSFAEPVECEHDYKAVVTAPTCLEKGYTTYTCSKCDDSYVADEVAAAGHKWDEGKVTTEPTADAEGVKTYSCTVCNETKTESIPKLPPVPVCPSKDFSDVPAEGNWAHEGIDYAVENGLMKGTGDGLFSPKGTLTRAELVTILYRAEGSPEVEFKGIFTDVVDNRWFSDAIEWAAANDVVNGVGDGKFDPNGIITREQIATMLYRYAGKPAAKGDLEAFPDKDSVRNYAKDAMIWATSKKIITGASKDGVAYLAPQADATREQIASIVMRYLKKTISIYPVTVAKELYTAFPGGEGTEFADGFKTGFGSAITFKGYDEDGNMQFYGASDRGPSLDLFDKDGNEVENTKVFPAPDFSPVIGVITLKDGKAMVEEAITLKKADGTPLKGLPLPAGETGATGEIALDIYGNELTYDPDGFDPEGIAVDKDGNFWLGDEYGPFIAKFAPDGTMLKMYKPGDGLPEILKYRIANRGFESLTISPSGKVFALQQSVMNINGETQKTATFIRILELDPETGATKMYAFPVSVSEYSAPKNCKLGDAFAIDDDTLLVVEQGKLADKSMRNVIYKVDLSEATDISGLTYNGKELEYTASVEELEKVMNYAEKKVYIDLRTIGWTAEKAEGICLTDTGALVAIIEDDFGMAGSEQVEGSDTVHILPNESDPSQIWIIE